MNYPYLTPYIYSSKMTMDCSVQFQQHERTDVPSRASASTYHVPPVLVCRYARLFLSSAVSLQLCRPSILI